MPLIPDDSEVVARYVYQPNYIRRLTNTIKYSAFLPNRKKDNETSVYRVSRLPESEIWNLAEDNVTQYQNKPLLGRAELNIVDVKQCGLNVIPKEPPYRHANITDWHLEKSEQILTAKQLEQRANLILVP